MDGLMQDVPLTIDLLLRRVEQLGAGIEVVSVDAHGEVTRRTWSALAERARRLMGVLDELGVGRGGRVGTFAWNTHRHLELYLAVPCSGRVLHTANVRLFEDDIAYVVRHAGDDVLFVDASLTGALAPLRDRLPVRAFVVMEDGDDVDPAFADCPRYDELLAATAPGGPTAPLAERQAASVCFTSGTTGRPKAVVYSHRSVLLHSLAQLGVDSHGVSREDVVLPATPMFHVNCWGLPYTCALAPAKLVLPGRDTSPEAIARLIESERVTSVAGVPTVWQRMLGELESGRHDLSSLRRVMCGGAEAGEKLIAAYTQRGIAFFHGWGATEMSPSGSAALVPPGARAGEMRRWGPSTPGVELRIVDETGAALPWDGVAVGEVEARGLWIAAAYHEPDDASNETRFTADGWWRTGDVGRIAPDGTLEVVDRAKDMIKSGGEWISSLELERAVLGHPDVAEAAAVAMPHPEWGERPAVLIVPEPGRPAPTAADVNSFLEGRVARWWLPDLVEIVDELPKTGVGKYDKRRIRELYEERLRRGATSASR